MLCLAWLSLAAASTLGGNLLLYYPFDGTASAAFFTIWAIFNGPYSPQMLAGILETPSSEASGSLLLSANEYPLVPGSVLQTSAWIGFNSTNLLGPDAPSSPLGFQEDPAYGTAVLGAFSIDGWRFALLLTNRMVYAVYAHITGLPETPDFQYIIPILRRTPADYRHYSILMDPGNYQLSFRIDNIERLRIKKVGQRISSCFDTYSDYNSDQAGSLGFPTAIQVLIGVGYLRRHIGINPGSEQGVCQRTVFNMCTQNILSSQNCGCQFGPRGEEFVDFALYSLYQELVIAQLQQTQTCEASEAANWWAGGNRQCCTGGCAPDLG